MVEDDTRPSPWHSSAPPIARAAPGRRITQKELAVAAGLDVSSINKILRRRPGKQFRPHTVDRMFQNTAELGYDSTRLKHHPRRRDRRVRISIPVTVWALLPEGQGRAPGAAVLRNLSASGAFLARKKMPGGAFPVKPSLLELGSPPLPVGASSPAVGS